MLFLYRRKRKDLKSSLLKRSDNCIFLFASNPQLQKSKLLLALGYYADVQCDFKFFSLPQQCV